MITSAEQGTTDSLIVTGASSEDIAQMVYTVAKSNFINDAIINVDGGMAAGHNLS